MPDQVDAGEPADGTDGTSPARPDWCSLGQIQRLLWDAVGDYEALYPKYSIISTGDNWARVQRGSRFWNKQDIILVYMDGEVTIREWRKM